VILEEADDLAQEDYDEAVERDIGDADEDFEEEKEDDRSAKRRARPMLGAA